MIGGDAIDDWIIVPPGGEPHDFELDIKSAKRLKGADCLFYLGNSIDDWVDQYKKTGQNDNMMYIPVADSHNDQFNQNDNPHIWLDPKNAAFMLRSICDALTELDPVNANYYSGNLSSCLSCLDELDKVYAETLSPYAGNPIIAAHDAYSYLCSAYGLVEMAVSGLEADEPSPGKLAKVIDFIRSNNIAYIYFENLSGKGASYDIAEIIKNETGAAELELNPFENNASIALGEDYFSVMYANLENILEGFR